MNIKELGAPPVLANIGVASEYVGMSDMESFSKITGILKIGIGKAIASVKDILPFMYTENVDYADIAKGFAGVDKSLQAVYNTDIGVPAGLEGTLLEITTYIDKYKNEGTNLLTELTLFQKSISMMMNSEDVRLSTSIVFNTKDITAKVKEMNAASDKFITKGLKDSKTIGQLIRSNNEVKTVTVLQKELSVAINIELIDKLKEAILDVDYRVNALVSNNDTIAKPNIVRLASHLDNLIEYTTAVATVIYLKNAVDIILRDISKIL